MSRTQAGAAKTHPERRPGNHRGEWMGRLGLLAGSLLMTLLFAEVALRVAGLGAPAPSTAEETGAGTGADAEAFTFFEHDPRLGWDLVPGASDRHRSPEFDVTIRITEQGLRATGTYTAEPAKGIRRAVILGDSFTFGHGVEVGDAWTARVEAALADAELVNLAVTGYGVDQMVLRLEERSSGEGIAFAPQLVVAAIFVGDVFRVVDDAYMGYRKPRFALDGDGLRLTGVPVPSTAPPAHGPPLGSRLAGLLGARAVPLFQHLGWGDAWPITARLLQRLRASTEAAGARLAVVVLPKDRGVLGQGLRSDVNRRAVRELDGLLDDLGIPHLDLTPALSAQAEASPDEALYYPEDGHWTVAGHRVAAQAVAQWLPQHFDQGTTR